MTDISFADKFRRDIDFPAGAPTADFIEARDALRLEAGVVMIHVLNGFLDFASGLALCKILRTDDGFGLALAEWKTLLSEGIPSQADPAEQVQDARHLPASFAMSLIEYSCVAGCHPARAAEAVRVEGEVIAEKLEKLLAFVYFLIEKRYLLDEVTLARGLREAVTNVSLTPIRLAEIRAGVAARDAAARRS